jgi:hypothetical protein
MTQKFILKAPEIEYFRSFSVVPPCEAFTSLFHNVYLTIGKRIRSNILSPSHILSVYRKIKYWRSLCDIQLHNIQEPCASHLYCLF